MKSIVQGLALTLASVVLVFVLTELLLHGFPSLLPVELRPDNNARGVRHPVIGSVLEPNSSGIMRTRDFAVPWQVDQHGFRNKGPWPAQVDVVVIGDSLVFGDGVAEDEAWPQLLARLTGLRVLNLGISGTSPQQYLAIYETYGRALQPKLVIVGFFGINDFTGAELFEGWRESGFDGNYVEWRAFGRPRGGDLAGSLLFVIRKHVYLSQLLRLGRNALRPDMATPLLWRDGTEMRLDQDYLLEQRESWLPGSSGFNASLDALVQMHNQAVAQGSKLVVVFQPSKEVIYLPFAGHSAPRPSAFIQAALQQRNIPALDLHPAFRAHAEAGERLYFPVDGHPNAAGYRLIAEQVADWMARDEEIRSMMGAQPAAR